MSYLIALLTLFSPLENARLIEGYQEFKPICEMYAPLFDLDETLVCAVAGYETEFDNLKVNAKSNATCAMQVIPGKWGRPSKRALLADPELCVETGAKYLAERFEARGDMDIALCEYNCGPRCYARSLRNYVTGVRWFEDFLRRVDDERPYGHYVCWNEIPLHRVDGSDRVLTIAASVPVYGADWRHHGRDTIRNYRRRLADELRNQLRYDVCKEHAPEHYNGCTHAPGRESGCMYVEAEPSPAMSFVLILGEIVVLFA